MVNRTAVLDIGIGDGEADAHTHIAFPNIDRGTRMIQVRTHLLVDKAAPVGLNFFAIQVNFPNHTWAHGGPQVNTGKQLANWGGLVSRGGGSKDYQKVNWAEDLKLIECGIGQPNTVKCPWTLNTQYILTVQRGKQVQLPAGTDARYKVEVPERVMWEWLFTIKPAGGGAEVYRALLYNSADHFNSFYLWNEAGYGSKANQQHTRWSMPTYRVEGSEKDVSPPDWKRF
ncbi:MAG: hypothetical protein GC164_04880 [Phycisphaera sp.]|nr:hypothetical protein [Phycisphaera sp.]